MKVSITTRSGLTVTGSPDAVYAHLRSLDPLLYFGFTQFSGTPSKGGMEDLPHLTTQAELVEAAGRSLLQHVWWRGMSGQAPYAILFTVHRLADAAGDFAANVLRFSYDERFKPQFSYLKSVNWIVLSKQLKNTWDSASNAARAAKRSASGR